MTASFSNGSDDSASIESNANPEDVTVLPHIIGGQDLVVHTEMNARKEEFLSWQPENDDQSEANDAATIRANKEFDTAFEVIPGTASRRLSRRR